MQKKLHASKNRSRVPFFETENKKRLLAITTHFKTTKIAAEKVIFLDTYTIDKGYFRTRSNI